MNCSYFASNRCRSCSLLGKNGEVINRLPALPDVLFSLNAAILPWVECGIPFYSRAKARMTVSGSLKSPIVGILDQELKGIELTDCPLHKDTINDMLKSLPALIKEFGLEPYQISSRKGMLKSVILQTNMKEDHLRVRFVLGDRNGISLCENIATKLQVISGKKFSSSVNIQPIPHQIPEGDEEIDIFGEKYLWEQYNETKLAFPPRSFMQVTPEIAAKLYQKVGEYVELFRPNYVLDLFCGAGGFAMSAAPYAKKVVGVEISKSAVEAATSSAVMNGFENIGFYALDLLKGLEEISREEADLLICNPPRRGLGEEVISLIQTMKPERILYSSCNYKTLLSDFNNISSLYKIVELTPFEMFPLTNHFEILALIERL